MKTLHQDEITPEFVPVDTSIDLVNPAKHFNSPIMMEIKKRYDLKDEDFILWENGKHPWIVIEKVKVQNTYFEVRTDLFLDNCQVGDKIDFIRDRYEITSITRTPSKLCDDNNIHVHGTFIKKDGTLGKRLVWISYCPSPISKQVIIDFSR